jgi:hypothetical protein
LFYPTSPLIVNTCTKNNQMNHIHVQRLLNWNKWSFISIGSSKILKSLWENYIKTSSLLKPLICTQNVYHLWLLPYSNVMTGPSWSWLYGNWIYYYLCNQCLTPLMSFNEGIQVSRNFLKNMLFFLRKLEPVHELYGQPSYIY